MAIWPSVLPVIVAAVVYFTTWVRTNEKHGTYQKDVTSVSKDKRIPCSCHAHMGIGGPRGYMEGKAGIRNKPLAIHSRNPLRIQDLNPIFAATVCW